MLVFCVPEYSMTEKKIRGVMSSFSEKPAYLLLTGLCCYEFSHLSLDPQAFMALYQLYVI